MQSGQRPWLRRARLPCTEAQSAVPAPLIPEFRVRTTEDDDGLRKGGRLYLPTVRQQWQRPDDARKRVHARRAEKTAARLLSSRGRNGLTSGDPRRGMGGGAGAAVGRRGRARPKLERSSGQEADV